MKGGAYKTQGADTCVYIPQVDCNGRRTTLRKAPAGTAFVSRITRDKRELEIQKAVSKKLKKLEADGHAITKFFNLADSACIPNFKPEDKRADCTIGALQGDERQFVNFITPVQGDTLLNTIRTKSKPDDLIKSSLKGVMLAMARLNADTITHSDSHFGNLGWRGDQLVIFDWGRGTSNLRAFKQWTVQYALSPPQSQTYWKSFSQHTLQFTLIDQLVQAKVFNKPASFESLMSVWDTLGLLGPAAASGVVTEQTSKLFLKDVFDTIRADWKKPMTDRLINTLIPNLFGGQSIIHPVVAEKPMPPAEAQVLVRVLPAPVINNPESTPPVAAAPPVPLAVQKAPKAPQDDKKLEDMKDACRKLLAPGGGTRRRRGLRRTIRRKRHQKGGDYLNSGADVLVWDRNPTADKPWLGLPIALITKDEKGNTIPETLSIPPGFGTLAKYGDPVVRMILLRRGEMDFHRGLKEWSETNPFVKMHLNTFAGSNGVYTTHPKMVVNDETLIAAATDPDIKAALEHDYFPGKYASKRPGVEALAKVDSGKWYGLITRRQQTDIRDMQDDLAIIPLLTLTQPLLRTDGFWIQYDLHDGNMALMLDGTPVIHDYGRMKFRDYDLKVGTSTPSFPYAGNTNILRNIIPGIAIESGNYGRYQPYWYVAPLMAALNGEKKIEERLNDSCYSGDYSAAVKEDEPGVCKIQTRRRLERKSIGDKKYIAGALASCGSLYKAEPTFVPNGIGRKEQSLTREEFQTQLKAAVDEETYLDSLFKDPVFETRYHQIARIWDLLALLKAIGLRAEDWGDRLRKPSAGAVYKNVATLSDTAAKTLVECVKTPHPTATREKVKDVVNKFCVAAAKLLGQEFTPMTDAEQDAKAITYWKNANEARDKGAPAPAPAPAPASGGVEPEETNKVLRSTTSLQREPDPEPALNKAISDEKTLYADTYGKEAWTTVGPDGKHRGGKITHRRHLPRLY